MDDGSKSVAESAEILYESSRQGITGNSEQWSYQILLIIVKILVIF